MNVNNKNNTPFKAEDVNWEELAGIGILKDELEMSGELDTLLKGEKTGVMSLSLVLLGVDVVMDATLQLVRKDDGALIVVICFHFSIFEPLETAELLLSINNQWFIIQIKNKKQTLFQGKNPALSRILAF